MHYRVVILSVLIINFTIGNVHPKFRSSLKFIHLVALAKNEHLKKYGMNNVLQRIVADVAKLEKVIIVYNCGIEIFYYYAIGYYDEYCWG